MLAWEMGEGLGHANRLLTLARLLKEAGWLPVVAARNPHALAECYATADIPLIATPPHRSCFSGPGRFRAASFADIMDTCDQGTTAVGNKKYNAVRGILTGLLLQTPFLSISQNMGCFALARILIDTASASA